MNKSEYLECMKSALSEFDADSMAEIMAECIKAFAEGELAGKTDAQIIEELGSVDECVEALRELTHAPDSAEHDVVLPFTGDYADVRHIKLNIHAKVELASGDVTYPDVKISGNRKLIDECVVETVDGTMCLRWRSESRWAHRSFRLRPPLNITIVLPRRMDTIDVRTGSLDAEGITADTFTASTAGGNLRFTSCTASRFECRTAGGDIDLSGIRTGALNASTSGGDIDIDSAEAPECSLKTAGGDIKTKGLVSNKLSAVSSGGDVGIDCGDCRSINVRSSGGDVSICCKNACSLSAVTAGGDIKASVADANSISLTSSGGDIDLKLRNGEGASIKCASAGGTNALEHGETKQIFKGSFGCVVGSGRTAVDIRSHGGDTSISINC